GQTGEGKSKCDGGQESEGHRFITPIHEAELPVSANRCRSHVTECWCRTAWRRYLAAGALAILLFRGLTSSFVAPIFVFFLDALVTCLTGGGTWTSCGLKTTHSSLTWRSGLSCPHTTLLSSRRWQELGQRWPVQNLRWCWWTSTWMTAKGWNWYAHFARPR